MSSKKYLASGLVAPLLLIVGALLVWILFGARNQGEELPRVGNVVQYPLPKVDHTLLFRYWSLGKVNGRYSINGLPAEMLGSDDGMYEVAVEDGKCTQEQVDEGACLNNLFYIRNAGEHVVYKIAPGTKVSVYAPGPGESVSEDSLMDLTLDEFISDRYLSAKPYLVELDVSGDTVVGIREVYIPSTIKNTALKNEGYEIPNCEIHDPYRRMCPESFGWLPSRYEERLDGAIGGR